MLAIIRNSVETTAATLMGAMLACLLIPVTLGRGGLERMAVAQIEIVVWGSLAGAGTYYVWRAITKAL